MQPTAGPDLPHTRTRLVHWLSTASALAAVVALAAVIQPSDATATSEASPASAEAAGSERGPDPRRADYPLDCGPWEVGVVSHASADFDDDGAPETIAVVRCSTEGGTPPSGVYVLTASASGAKTPRVVKTLVDPAERLSVDDFAVRDGVISLTLRGYSSDEVPRCCPDLERAVNWRWTDGQFKLSADAVAANA